MWFELFPVAARLLCPMTDPRPIPAMPSGRQPDKRAGRGFSITSLLLLTTLVASITPMVVPLMRKLIERPVMILEVIPIFIGVSIAMGKVGLMLGLHQYDRWNALSYGGLGLVVGLLIAPLVFLEAEALVPAAIAIVSGSVIIVGFAAFARSRSRIRPR